MLKNIKCLAFFVGLTLIFACNDTTTTNDHAATQQHDGEDGHDHADHQTATATEKYFGAKITADKAISYDELLEKMTKTDSLDSKVIGKVTEVCQKKGCWMSIAASDPNKQEMFVKFKDYEFFMPLDIAGRKVVMEGYAFKTTTSVEELQHYAEDAGKSKEEIAAITEPEDELQFLASGVILLEED